MAPGKGMGMAVDTRASAGHGGDGPISPQALSDLAGAIYDCVLDPSRWPVALAAMRHALDCHNVALALQDLPSGRGVLHICDGIEPHWLERLPDYGADVVELWGGLEAYNALPLLEPLILSQTSPRRLDDNRYFREWVRPQGLCDALGIGLARDAVSVGSIGFGRHESSGPLGAREVGIARLLVPHLHRAIVITRLLDARGLAATTFETVFDTIATPIIIVGASLTVMHANQAARASFDQRAPLFVEKGHLASTSRTAIAALAAAIEQIGRDEGAIGAQGLGIPVVATGGGTCVLHVLPMRRGRLSLGMPANAVAAIFVASRTTPAQAPAELIRTLFGLTAAEGKVYELVAAGATMAQAATRLGVEPSTVKTHLLRIYGKTGTHRRGELVALAESLAAPAQVEPLA